MLADLRRLFRESIAAFRAELATREPEDQVAELLAAMRKELVAAKAAIRELEEEARRTRSRLDREREELASCERRKQMAERIGDAETVRIADEFAARHRERVKIFETKAAAVDAELVLRRRESDEMTQKYRDADANRFSLLAQLRRAARVERGAAGDEVGLEDDFARMEERVNRESSIVDALEELDDTPRAQNPSAATDRAIDDRLNELKRRMGKQ